MSVYSHRQNDREYKNFKCSDLLFITAKYNDTFLSILKNIKILFLWVFKIKVQMSV